MPSQRLHLVESNLSDKQRAGQRAKIGRVVHLLISLRSDFGRSETKRVDIVAVTFDRSVKARADDRRRLRGCGETHAHEQSEHEGKKCRRRGMGFEARYFHLRNFSLIVSDSRKLSWTTGTRQFFGRNLRLPAFYATATPLVNNYSQKHKAVSRIQRQPSRVTALQILPCPARGSELASHDLPVFHWRHDARFS